MEGEFDAVFGVFFHIYSLDYIAALFGKIDASPKPAVNVEIAVLVVRNPETGGVIGRRFRRNGKVVAAFPLEAGRGVGNDIRKPRPLEQPAAGRCRPLLVKCGERIFTEPAFCFLEMIDIEALRPQRLAGKAVKRIGSR